LKEITPQTIRNLRELYPTGWIKNHKILNEAGLPIEFSRHRFMHDPYNDMSPFQVWLKAPQIGATVAQIIKTLYCAYKKAWDIIYTLPTQADVNDMAGGKINRIIAQNPILMSWVKDHDTVEQKSVGKQIVYYRGTFSNKQAMMVSSDLNVHDEVDASDASVIAQYETRLQAKASGRRWYFSHPSLAGFGVDIHWQKSDKKEWFVTCPVCEKEQALSFPENINFDKRCYQCSECKADMSDNTRLMGKWKATSGICRYDFETVQDLYPGLTEFEGKEIREFSGYHISQLMCVWITADKILRDKAEKTDQYFFNYVLGLPYVGSDNKIDSAIVLKNVVSTVNPQDDTIVMGVDTGLPIHYTIGNKHGIFHYGKCKAPSADYDPYDELERLLNRWEKSIIVADQGGDLVGIRKLQAKYPGRVFLCYYRRDRKSTQMIQWGKGNDFGMVVVDRNRMIQMIVEQLRDIGRIRFNGSVIEWEEFAEHFDNIFRVVKETPFGAEYTWERNGPDHFLHTLVYLLVGLDKYAMSEAIIVGEDALSDIGMAKIFE
jgi:hypothetical protein